MRRYASLAAPDDQGAWIDLRGFVPTPRGSYRVADFINSSNKTATGETLVKYVFCARTTTTTRNYIVGTKIWEYGLGLSGSMTDRTNGVTIGSFPYMAEYGDITICAMGNSTVTVNSSGGNFSALAGAPKANIVLVHKNAVVYLNTDLSPDGWATSDVGDYTNYTTGEAASGRLINNNGPIIAGCIMGDYVYAFKTDSIYRGSYVGGLVKWAWELVHVGKGGNSSGFGKYTIVSCGDQIVYQTDGFDSSASSCALVMSYDGIREPIRLNTEVALDEAQTAYYYDDQERVVYVNPVFDGVSGNYSSSCVNLDSGAWGKGHAMYVPSPSTPVFVHGRASDISQHYFSGNNQCRDPIGWYFNTTNTVTLQYPIIPSSATADISPYIRSSKTGAIDYKTTFRRLAPVLRRRADISGRTPSISLVVNGYRERHDTATVSTQTVSESTIRKRFDFVVEENYVDFKVTFTNIDTEIDDFLLDVKKGAKE